MLNKILSNNPGEKIVVLFLHIKILNKKEITSKTKWGFFVKMYDLSLDYIQKESGRSRGWKYKYKINVPKCNEKNNLGENGSAHQKVTHQVNQVPGFPIKTRMPSNNKLEHNFTSYRKYFSF